MQMDGFVDFFLHALLPLDDGKRADGIPQLACVCGPVQRARIARSSDRYRVGVLGESVNGLDGNLTRSARCTVPARMSMRRALFTYCVWRVPCEQPGSGAAC
jgi:hypothetical protein